MKTTTHLALGTLTAMLMLSAQAQQPAASGPPPGERDLGAAGPQAPATTYQVDIHMQANSALFKSGPVAATPGITARVISGPSVVASTTAVRTFPKPGTIRSPTR